MARFGAPAKVQPAADPAKGPCIRQLPTPIGRTPILVRLFKATDKIN